MKKKNRRLTTDTDSSALLLHQKHIRDARTALDELQDKQPKFKNYEKLLLDIQDLKEKVTSYEDIIFRCEIISTSLSWLWNERSQHKDDNIGFRNSMYLLINSLEDTLKS